MVDASTFNLQPNFPIAGVADLYANRSVKEAAMRAQQQQQLVQGLQQFGQGVDSLTNRRIKMAQALAAAHLFSGTPSGQEALGTNQVTTAGQMPVAKNQTAAYDPATGTVTPNKGSATMDDLSTAMYGVEPKDFLANMTAQKQLSYEPQKLANESQRIKAELENQRILREIQLRLAGVTENHTNSEDIANLIGKRTEEEKNVASGLGSIFETDKSKQARKNIAEINALLTKKGFTSAGNLTPAEQAEFLALEKRFGGGKK